MCASRAAADFITLRSSTTAFPRVRMQDVQLVLHLPPRNDVFAPRRRRRPDSSRAVYDDRDAAMAHAAHLLVDLLALVPQVLKAFDELVIVVLQRRAVGRHVEPAVCVLDTREVRVVSLSGTHGADGPKVERGTIQYLMQALLSMQ